MSVKVADEFARNGNIKDLGSSSPFDSFAFSANPGDVNQPVQLGQKFAVIKLVEKKPVDMSEFAKTKENLRLSLVTPKKDKVFEAYTEAVKEKMTKAGKIKIDEAQFAAISRRYLRSLRYRTGLENPLYGVDFFVFSATMIRKKKCTGRSEMAIYDKTFTNH